VSNQEVRRKFRIALPAAMGGVSATLTAWDIYNWKVIVSMGMACDTCAPIWPYQTSDILLRLIDFPAFLVAMPLANDLHLLSPGYHWVVFPVGLVWWWFIGWMFDRRNINRPRRGRWAKFVSFLICCGLLTSAAIAELASVLHWYLRYGGAMWSINKLGLLRLMTPVLWFAAYAVIFAMAAKTNLIDRHS
jgi:hypothetical protein